MQAAAPYQTTSSMGKTRHRTCYSIPNVFDDEPKWAPTEGSRPPGEPHAGCDIRHTRPLASKHKLRSMESNPRALRILILNTIPFTVCFAVWTMYGVLITFLIHHSYLQIDKAQMG